MIHRAPSPTQIRAQAALAFRRHQATAASSGPLVRVLTSVDAASRTSRAALRAPMTGETPLSGDEVRHAVYHGLIEAPAC